MPVRASAEWKLIMYKNVYFPEGMLINTKSNNDYTTSLFGLKRALSDGAILEGTAIHCDSSRNLTVNLGGGIFGVIPRQETALGIENGVKEIAILSRVGKTVCFKVVSAPESGGSAKIILSRKAAQEEAYMEYVAGLESGAVIPAVVTHLEPFGAFVDISCGIISMIGIENISVSRLPDPSGRFFTGQKIYAAVLSNNNVTKRVTLTHKELLGTWSENAKSFSPGEVVYGMVRGIKDYGIFIELAPNLSGLAERCEGYRENEAVSVYIKSIIPELMKIKLLIIDHADPPRLPSPLNYFISGGKLNIWNYSPAEYKKPAVRTVFTGL